MKYISYIYALSLMAAVCSCSGNSADNTESDDTNTRTSVTLTHAEYGNIRRELTMTATTAYLSKVTVATPISGYVKGTYVTQGAKVAAGQLLYEIESRESRALGSENGGVVIPIHARQSGIVIDALGQDGCYVAEGSTLCSTAPASSLAFVVNVPSEQRLSIPSGKKFTIELPDGTRLLATVKGPLAAMNEAAQTERVVAYAKAPFLPEGMTVKAIFTDDGKHDGRTLVLPKGAVQSDEMLTEHWVMKLSTDGTLVKIPVETGQSNSTDIEVISDRLTPQDSVILDGAYGLEEGAKVEVAKD